MNSIHAIHFYGDSLTAGYGAAPEAGWIPRLAKDFPALTLYNHGVCGRLFSDVLEDAWTVVHYPADGEALFLMGGTNDILCGIRYDALLAHAEREIRALSVKIPVILGVPPLATRRSILAGWQAEWQFEKNQAELSSYADFLRALAADLSLPVMDFAAVFPAEDAYYADGIHPNEKGYEIFSRTAEDVLKNFLAK